MRDQACPSRGRSGPLRCHLRPRVVPRAHPGDSRRDRTAEEARGVPSAPRRASRASPYGDVGALEDAVASPAVTAVLLEAIEGEAGVVVPPAGYLTAVRRVCDQRGILLMLDEIQTGLGRTGRWFAFQHEAIRPDVVTIAKSLGNGMPIGACWARRDVAAAFVAGDHGSTFGGQPLACAAGIATLAELEAVDGPRLARQTGAYLAHRLEGLAGSRVSPGKGLAAWRRPRAGAGCR